MPEPLLLQARYRNKLEVSVGEQLTAAGISFDYEGAKVPFVVPQRTAKYLPDFRVGNIIIESKGWFGRGAKERQKLVFVRESNPELDIRIVFSDANKRIYKNSPTTYAKWADDHGFQWSTKGVIPQDWIKDLKRASGAKSTKAKNAGSGQAKRPTDTAGFG
jgi:hypothetical protein